jgi:uncharacterized membrane protein
MDRLRSNEFVDRWFPWVFATAVSLVFFGASRLRAYTLDAGFDLAYFKQAAWQVSHGQGAFLSVRGVHLFADHAYFVMYPIGWLSRLVPITPLLLGLQAAGLAFAAVPLYRICRGMAGLPPATSALVLAVYALHPAIQNANIFEFHPETVTAPVAFLGAVWFGHRNRWVACGVCVAVLLASREDFVFVVAGLALVHLLGGRRRPALAMLGAAAVWFVVVSALMARFPGATEIRATRLQPYGTSALGAAAFLGRHPRLLWHQLTRPENFDVLIGLLGPVLFLPLLAPTWLLPAAGLELVYMLSNVAPAHTIGFQYTLVPGLVVVLAAAVGLGRLRAGWGSPVAGRARPPDQALLVPLLVGALLFSLHASSMSARQQPWRWARRDAVDRARLAAAHVPPPDASVAASASILPLVAARRSAYFFPAPFAAYAAELHPPDPVPLAERIAGVRYLLIDTTTIPAELHAKMIPDVLHSLTDNGAFEELWVDHGVEVWRRSGP